MENDTSKYIIQLKEELCHKNLDIQKFEKLKFKLSENPENLENDEEFYLLPLSIILSIVSKIDFSYFDQPILSLQNILKKILNSHFDEQETILLLQNININTISPTYDDYFNIISKFTNCQFLVNFYKIYDKNKRYLNIDYRYKFEKQNEEIINLKKQIEHLQRNGEDINDNTDNFIKTPPKEEENPYHYDNFLQYKNRVTPGKIILENIYEAISKDDPKPISNFDIRKLTKIYTDDQGRQFTIYQMSESSSIRDKSDRVKNWIINNHLIQMLEADLPYARIVMRRNPMWLRARDFQLLSHVLKQQIVEEQNIENVSQKIRFLENEHCELALQINLIPFVCQRRPEYLQYFSIEFFQNYISQLNPKDKKYSAYIQIIYDCCLQTKQISYLNILTEYNISPDTRSLEEEIRIYVKEKARFQKEKEADIKEEKLNKSQNFNDELFKMIKPTTLQECKQMLYEAINNQEKSQISLCIKTFPIALFENISKNYKPIGYSIKFHKHESLQCIIDTMKETSILELQDYFELILKGFSFSKYFKYKNFKITTLLYETIKEVSSHIYNENSPLIPLLLEASEDFDIQTILNQIKQQVKKQTT